MIESPGLVSRGTALVRAEDLTGTTECGGAVLVGQRRDAVTYSWPSLNTLRRSHVWVQVPDKMRRPDLDRFAHHEAGHVVMMREFGLESPKAVATDRGGEASWPSPLPDATARSVPDPHEEPRLAATASAVYAAGCMAELLHLGIPWRGPLHYPLQPDYEMSEKMMKPYFGAHSSAAHAFAQCVALHVLQSRWSEVQAIARVLIERGEWVPV